MRTAVIPAAGLGTRFLPYTKSVPKELLPVLDTPTLQYIVREAVAAGLERVVVVVSPTKRAIAQHFATDDTLAAALTAAGNHDALRKVRAVTDLADIQFVVQQSPRGLGDAVLCARPYVGDEAFAVLLGDDLLLDDGALLRTMIATHHRTGGAVLALREVAAAAIHQYGCAAVSDTNPMRVHALVEKPAPGEAPSNLAIFGRYILTPEVFDALAATPPGRNNEVQLTDALTALVASASVFANRCVDTTYDMGTRLGVLRANIDVALRDPELAAPLQDFLADRIDALDWSDSLSVGR